MFFHVGEDLVRLLLLLVFLEELLYLLQPLVPLNGLELEGSQVHRVRVLIVVERSFPEHALVDVERHFFELSVIYYQQPVQFLA